nr:MAG TPA: AAA domain protein [Caudoviricetes sp.]
MDSNEMCGCAAEGKTSSAKRIVRITWRDRCGEQPGTMP